MFKWPNSEPSIPAAPLTPVKAPTLVTHLAPVDAVAEAQVEPIQVEHSDDLPVFSRKLYDVITLMPSLKHRVCPIDVSTQEDRNRFAVILLQSELNTDLTEKVVEEFACRGWTLASAPYYVASPSVMDELARDAINNHTTGKGGTAKKHDSALWSLFESAASFALTNGASDIHIRINRSREHSQIRFRIDGRLTRPREFEMPTLRLLDMVAYIYNIHSNAGSENVFNENAPQQCQVFATIKGTKVLFRWASMKTGRGTKVVMRVIVQDTESPKTLNELGYLDPQIKVWERAITRLGGGILVGGVVNSGKSTTLQTVMSMMPEWMAKISVEDPIENFIVDTDQFSVSRALSDGDTDPFIAVKRQTKRMDPDVVMIAEIRDRESAGLFRDIAESGHRAFATVHAPSAIDMITLRLVSTELGIPRDVIATPNFLNLLVYQALVPKLCPCCKQAAEHVYDDEYLLRIERLFAISRSRIKAQNKQGCEECSRKGLPELAGTKGRVVVAEMIEPTPKMLLLFRDAKNLELKRHVRGMRTAAFDEPDSTGKSALEVAMYHVAHGLLDPREVEMKFGSFQQYETEQAEYDAFAAVPASSKRLAGTFTLRRARRPGQP